MKKKNGTKNKNVITITYDEKRDYVIVIVLLRMITVSLRVESNHYLQNYGHCGECNDNLQW